MQDQWLGQWGGEWLGFTSGNNPPEPPASRLHYWDGNVWTPKTLKYWDGAAWQAKSLKFWNGTSWI